MKIEIEWIENELEILISECEILRGKLDDVVDEKSEFE